MFAAGRAALSSRVHLRRGRRSTTSRRSCFRRLLLEHLEHRWLLAGESITVSTLADGVDGQYELGHLSLREALNIAAARPGDDVIQFDGSLATGQILLDSTLGQLRIDSNVDIRGIGASELAIDADGASRILAVLPGITATMSGLRLTGGYANDRGGGIENLGVLTISDSAITDCSAGSVGGAIYSSGSLTITHSTVSANSAGQGGGAILSEGPLAIADATISNNSADGSGGAIQSWDVLTVSGSTISGNWANADGGAIQAWAPVGIVDSIIADNGAAGDGGGVQNWESVSMLNSTFRGNAAGSDGGAIQAWGSLTVAGSTLADNSADRDGGAVQSWAAVRITTSSLSGNSAVSDGGGIQSWGPLAIAGSTVVGNVAGESGGGIQCQEPVLLDGIETAGSVIGGEAMTIVNSTVTGNAAGLDGGGIVCWTTLDMTNVTITDNWADNHDGGSGAGGGLRIGLGSSATLHNTIVAGNHTGTAQPLDDDVFGLLKAASSFNLIGVDDGGLGLTHGENGNQVGSPGTPIDPLLLPLRDYGGSTQTHGLQVGSPALDTGSNDRAADAGLSVDQRGESRLVDGDHDGINAVDIGAFEWSGRRAHGLFPVEQFPVGPMPVSALLVDLNGDTVLDAVTVNLTTFITELGEQIPGTVSVLIGNPDGSFKDQSQYDLGGSSMSVATGDFNGDGITDLVTANFDTSDVSLLLGNADGTFSEQVAYGVGQAPLSVAVGDFDSDGLSDLATANTVDGTISLLFGSENGSLSRYDVLNVGREPMSLAVADMNGDGLSDILVGAAEHDESGQVVSQTVSVLLGNGDGTFGLPSSFPCGTTPSWLIVQDLDGDQQRDALAISGGLLFADDPQSAGYVAVLMGDGTGGLAFHESYSLSAVPLAVTTGDFNYDGTEDLAATATNLFSGEADPLQFNGLVLLANGDGTFAEPIVTELTTLFMAAAAGDADGDGLTDLLVANPNMAVLAGSSGGRSLVSVLRGNGDGTFFVPPWLPAGDEPASVAVGQFDDNGTADMVTANYRSNDLSVLLNNGDGSFADQVKYSVGEGPTAVIICDLNGDEASDLVTSNSGSDDISVLLGNGDGTFTQAVSYSVGRQPGALSAADLDGDGKCDIVVANSLDGTVSILLGDGSGGFAPARNFPVGEEGELFSIAIGDLSGDGIPDLTVAHGTSADAAGSVSTHLGNGDGSFASPTVFEMERYPVAIAVADLDRDGSLDVLTANFQFSFPVAGAPNDGGVPMAANGDGFEFPTIVGSLTVFRGAGDGTLGEATTYVLEAIPFGVAVGDLDTDGFPDVVLPSCSDYLLLQNGLATDPSVLLSNGDGTQRIYIRCALRATDLSVLLSNGDGTLGRETRFSLGVNTRFLGGNTFAAIADVTGDSRQDVVAADYKANRVRVLINQGIVGRMGHQPAGEIEGPVDSITLYFPGGMDTTSFSLADDIASFSGPAGPLSATGYRWIDSQTLEITFAPQTAAGAYEMVVGPQILNSAGTPMNLDGDAVAGEVPDDRYTATFTIAAARPGPRVIGHQPTGDQVDPVSEVIVEFNELIRPATFTADDIEIIGPSGAVSVTENPTHVQGSSYRITFPEQTAFGLYSICIGPDVENVAGVKMDQDRDGIVAEDIEDRYDAAFTIIDVRGFRVTGHAPGLPVQGPLGYVDFTFDEPITGASFGVSDVVITGPAGPIAASDVEPLAPDQFRVHFPAQSAEGAYSVSIGPQIADVAGNLMDQDQDGQKAEPDDIYTANVGIDRTRPTVVSHSLAAIENVIVTRFEVTFDEPLGTSSFTADAVIVVGPKGSYSATEIHAVTARKFEVVLPGKDADGVYEITVASTVADLAGNTLAAPYQFTFEQRLADLRVSNVTYAAECLSGQEIEIQWTVMNEGLGTAQGGWLDMAYWSEDNQPGNDTLIAGLRFEQPLGPGESYTRAATFTVPQNSEGNRWIIIHADKDGELDEAAGDAGNIYMATPPTWVTTRFHADLQVTAVVVPETLSAGEQATVSWTVRNLGTGATSAAFWHDGIYLSSDTQLDGSDIELASVRNPDFLSSGESYTQTVEVLIPESTPRDSFYLIVKADADDKEEEFSRDDNNAAHSPDTTEVSTPDLGVLTVLSVADPGVRAPGSQIDLRQLTWTIQNTGGSTIYPGGFGYWDDGVAISRDEFYNESEDVWLSGHLIHHAQPLAPGETRVCTNDYSAVRTPLPNWEAGVYYLILIPDGHWFARTQGQEVPRNYGVVPITLAYADPPDLTVTSVAAPPTGVAGQTIQIDWRVENQGAGGTRVGSWSDEIYLSADNVLDGDDVSMGKIGHGWGLARNQGYDVHAASLLVPGDLAAGTYYVLVKADAAREVSENNENNNWRASPTTVAIAAPVESDLQVVSADADTTATAGQKLAVQWIVINNGPATTIGSTWEDAVYLSQDATLNTKQDRRVGTFVHAGALDREQTYERSVTVDLPDGIEGSYHLFVVTDHRDVLYEHNAEGNNSLHLPHTIEITDLAPDLAVLNVLAPTSAIAGRTIQADWSVGNIGGEAAAPTWDDAFYLSSDETLDAEADTLLATFTRHVPLDAGQSYGQPGGAAELTLPDGLQGRYYLFFVADSGKKVDEKGLEANNVWRQTIEITDLVADLWVQSATAPAFGMAGEFIAIDFRVTNQGEETAVSPWNDAFYLSSDTQLDPQVDRRFGSVSHTQPVAVGQVYGPPGTPTYIRLPDRLEGTFYIFLVTDDDNDVSERDGEANNVYLLPQPIEVSLTPADLLVGSVHTPAAATAGAAIDIAWTVANEGPEATDETVWRDGVYLSADDVFEPAGDIELGIVGHSGALSAGESYAAGGTFTLRQDLEGPYHVYVVTDVRRQVFEHTGENNNTTAAGHTLSVTGLHADLMVTALDVPADNVAGNTIPVQWTVTNTGPDATPGSHWSDSVYLSEDTVLDESDTPLGTFPYNGRLPAGGAYTQSRSLDLPQGVAGTFQIIVKTDSSSRNDLYEYQAEYNNTRAAAVELALSPPTDLQVTQIAAPATAWSGQSMRVEWTVTNTGGTLAQSPLGSWYDSVYLSRDPYLDRQSDIHLGAVLHEGPLAPDGGFYTGILDARLSAGVSGPYYVFVVTDANDRVTEREAEANNASAAATPVQISLTPPADLQVTAVIPPASGVYGEPAVWRYEVTNMDTLDAVGSWYDTIYLSTDQQWDLEDARIARVHHEGDVPHGRSYVESVTADIPAVLPGDYYVIARTDILDDLRELDETNNTGVSSGTFHVAGRELTVGVPVSGNLWARDEFYYQVNVPGGQDFAVILRDVATEQPELYVADGRIPTRTDYDVKASRTSDGRQAGNVSATQGGIYYILIYGNYASGAHAYSLSAEPVLFSVQSVAPDRVGNAGFATLAISGARFSPETAFELVDADGAATTAVQVLLDESTLAYATFDCDGLEPGDYMPRAVHPTEAPATYAGVVQIGDGLGANVVASLDGPTLVRSRRPGVMELSYSNTGDQDGSPPLFVIEGGSGTSFGLEAGQVSSRRTLHVLGLSQDGPPDILRPGTSHTLPVSYRSSDGGPDLRMRAIDADDTSPIEDLSEIEAAVRPPGISDAEWQEFWANIPSRIGTTWGQYVRCRTMQHRCCSRDPMGARTSSGSGAASSGMRFTTVRVGWMRRRFPAP